MTTNVNLTCLSAMSGGSIGQGGADWNWIHQVIRMYTWAVHVLFFEFSSRLEVIEGLGV